VRIAEGQRVRLEGRQALANLATLRAADAFDNWVLEREVQFAELAPSTEQLATGYEYSELDRYGEWYDEPSYGRVWMPSYAYGGYDPFRYGHWQHYGMGRTWVSSVPWGFQTFHSGRWAYLNHLDRWCWVPTRRFHDRDRFAHDDTPHRRHRGDRRSDDDGNDGTPVAIPRGNNDGREPVATIPVSPRRIDADQAPILRRDAGLAKPSRRDNPAPRVNPEPAPPARSASAPAPQSTTTTMRPSRPAEPRREVPSSPTPATSREIGTYRTR
jgi:hypothetical protein